MRWLEPNNSQGLELNPPADVPAAIWRILANRGITSREEIDQLYNPKLKDLAHPFSIDQMDVAVRRLIRARENQENILIYADYDLDGTPGLALLYDGLTRLGFNHISLYQPSRLKEGYGLHAKVVQDFAKSGVSLIVTVDVGITDLEAVNLANQLNIDVIVTDHHLPKDTLPPALAVLNPNKGTCSSKLQHLCGAGVAFYLVLALKMELSQKKLLATEFDAKELLDLFALATITDMVPMIKENRVLVKHGLKQLAKTTRPGLSRLFSELGFYNKNLSSVDVAFRIAPKLNALTRLEAEVKAIDVFLATEKNAKSLIDEVLIINQKRVLFQEQAKKIAQELLQNSPQDNLVWIHSKDFHPGVISLLASELMNTYQVPAFVGAVHEGGKIIGSARSPSEHFNLQEILTSASSVLKKFGGHKLAAGFELNESDIEPFLNLMNAHLTQEKTRAKEEPAVQIDAEVKLSELDLNFMRWYEGLGPFGVQFEVPKLALKRAKVHAVKQLKGGYLKYTLEQSGLFIEAPWFSSPTEFPKELRVDVLFEPQYNEFRGQKTIQALIHSMRPALDS